MPVNHLGYRPWFADTLEVHFLVRNRVGPKVCVGQTHVVRRMAAGVVLGRGVLFYRSGDGAG